MKKPLKIGLVVLGIVIGLLIVAIVVLTIVVDPNRYRDDIIQAVKTHTGRDLKIEGKLRLSFFPWLGLETGALQLANAPGFGSEPFARVESAAIRVELLPLLRKRVVVDAVRLKGMRLHLARAANGRTNWDDLAGKQPDAKPEPKQPGAAAAFAVFTVNRLEIRDAEFTYRDQAAGTAVAVRRIELTSGNLLSERPAALRLAFDFENGAPKITRRVELDAKLNVDLATQTLNVPEFRLSSGDLKVQAQWRATELLTAPKLKGKVDVPAFNLRALLKELQIAYAPADGNALKKVALATQVDYGPKVLSISDLRVTLDDTQVTGKFTQQQKPATSYAFDLAIDNIDLDRYLPVAAADPNKKAQPKAEAAVIPIVLLRNTEADGALRIQKLKAFGIRSEQVTVKVAAHGGRIVLGPNEAKLYGGTYAGRTIIDASGATPRFQFDEKLAGVQLGPLLKDADVFKNFGGAANITLALTGQGLDAEGIKRTLNGSAAFNIKDGAIEGVDLAKIDAKIREIRDQPGGTGKNLLAALPEFKPAPGDKTPFSKLQASATVSNGVVSNKDLALEAPPLRVTGSGTVNLVSSTFENYLLQVGNIPLIVSGPFADPKLRPDWNAILKGQTQQKIEQKKDEAADKLRDRLRDKLKR